MAFSEKCPERRVKLEVACNHVSPIYNDIDLIIHKSSFG